MGHNVLVSRTAQPIPTGKSCEVCGRAIMVRYTLSRAQIERKRFCSPECRGSWAARHCNPMDDPLVRARHGARVAAGWSPGIKLKARAKRDREQAAKERRAALRVLLKRLAALEEQLESGDQCRCDACERATRRWRKQDWNSKNPEKVGAMRRRYKALNKGALGRATAQQLRWRLEYYGSRCAYCCGPLGTCWHWDHVIPLSRGGSHWPANLRPSCPSCNRLKSDQYLHEFIGG